ncbi:MAG: TlyA family rRNA (cytidine-2'-O)-methyltransferase, partial [Nitrospirae bacterium]
TNIRYMERERVPEDIDLITIDVSFISLTKVLPRAVEFLRPEGEIVALVKPQFELSKKEVEKGGVIKTEAKREKALQGVIDFALKEGLEVLGKMTSPVKGAKGNVEYLLYLRKPAR